MAVNLTCCLVKYFYLRLPRKFVANIGFWACAVYFLKQPFCNFCMLLIIHYNNSNKCFKTSYKSILNNWQYHLSFSDVRWYDRRDVRSSGRCRSLRNGLGPRAALQGAGHHQRGRCWIDTGNKCFSLMSELWVKKTQTDKCKCRFCC
jgi:hypothetical protein